MSWATPYIAALKAGETVRFRPRGGSMAGRVESGQLCTVEPVMAPPQVDSIVLCTVRGAQYLHIVKARRGDQYQIGNNRGGVNGWITIRGIHGKLTAVE